jgi:hypothetical protein
MKRPIPTQRAAAATAAIGDKIYVAGGMSTMGRNVTVREFAAYDSVTTLGDPARPAGDPAQPRPGGRGRRHPLPAGGRSGPPNSPRRPGRPRPCARSATRMEPKAAEPRTRGDVGGCDRRPHRRGGRRGEQRRVNSMRVFPKPMFDPAANRLAHRRPCGRPATAWAPPSATCSTWGRHRPGVVPRSRSSALVLSRAAQHRAPCRREAGDAAWSRRNEPAPRDVAVGVDAERSSRWPQRAKRRGDVGRTLTGSGALTRDSL